MKTKLTLALLASFFLLGGTAFAFHDGGVAHCDGCHSMHNSADNPRAGSATAAYLMKGSDASSTCLNCHNGSGGYHVASADGTNAKAGGDFFWITAAGAYPEVDHSGNPTTTLVDADNHGHNVVAQDFSMAADATNTSAPGGTMNSATLGCTSCHNPHGQVSGGTAGGAAPISASGSYGADVPTDGSILGNYRLLGDNGYKTITAAAPVARADSSSAKAVDYGTGMSSWCETCHPAMADTTNMHPTGNVTQGGFAGIYNAYVKTGDYTGDATTSYDALVPFEKNISVGANLLDVKANAGIDGTAGPDGTAKVMCLSCHRAHASAFDNMLRWDGGAAFLAESAVLVDQTAGVFSATAVPYYKDGAAIDMTTTYGEYQRQLCNKCHAKD